MPDYKLTDELQNGIPVARPIRPDLEPLPGFPLPETTPTLPGTTIPNPADIPSGTPPFGEGLDPVSIEDFILRSQAEIEAELTAELGVVPRPGMGVEILTDIHGREVKVYGQAERSSSTTPGHAEAMRQIIAEALQRTDRRYAHFTLQRSWRTATGRVATSNSRPDVIGVRSDGKVDAWEVRSNSQDSEELRLKLEEGLKSLPEERRGEIQVKDSLQL